MKIAVVVFPGSNCDIDMYEAFHTVCKADVEYVSYKKKAQMALTQLFYQVAFLTATT